MSALAPDFIQAINEVLSGFSTRIDMAVDCVQQMGAQPVLDESELALLTRITAAPPSSIFRDTGSFRQYSRLELITLRVLERHVGNKIVPLVVTALGRAPHFGDIGYGDFVPAYAQGLLELAETHLSEAPSIPRAINDFLQTLPSILSKTNNRFESEWEDVGVTCCKMLGDSKYADAVPTLDETLRNASYACPLLVAAVEGLGRIGTEAAIQAICGVFPRREQSSGTTPGCYRRPCHDLLCGKATEIIVQIGTRNAFDVFTAQIDEANRRAVQDDIDRAWHIDVEDVLSKKLPEVAQRNLTSALLENQLSDATRTQLMGDLLKHRQTARLLKAALRPDQPGYELGTKLVEYLDDYFTIADEHGDEPGDKTYIRFEYPPPLEKATAIQYQSLFVSSGLPALHHLFIEELNTRLTQRDMPEIDTLQEVPLARLKIVYPHESALSMLKHSVLPRTDVGANWAYVLRTAEHFPRRDGDEMVCQQGDVVLTSLRLIISGLPLFYPIAPQEGAATEKRAGADASATGMFLLRDLDDVSFDGPIIRLRFRDLVIESNVQISIAYPGASVLSAIAGLTLPGASIEQRLNATEVRAYHRELDAKQKAAELVLNQFFVDVVSRNLKHGKVMRVLG